MLYVCLFFVYFLTLSTKINLFPLYPTVTLRSFKREQDPIPTV